MTRALILPVGRRRRPAGGFTYPLALIGIVIVSLFSTVANEVVSKMVLREHEQEFLFRGMAYQRAIKSYYEATNPASFPRQLAHLLMDPRFDNRRHIRALYSDPITNGPWEPIYGVTGGIIGVKSRSNKVPQKQGNFPLGLESFEGAKSYSDWTFVFEPARVSRQTGGDLRRRNL